MHILQIEDKIINKDGKTFKAYKALFGKLRIDIKLKKTAKPCVYDTTYGRVMRIEAEKCHLTTNKNGYPVIWVE